MKDNTAKKHYNGAQMLWFAAGALVLCTLGVPLHDTGTLTGAVAKVRNSSAEARRVHR